MSSIQVLIKGLCLWLPLMMNQLGGLPVIVPEFTGQVNAHIALLSIPVSAIDGGVCPDGFSGPDPCVYNLNGKGLAGGVTIDFPTGASPLTPNPSCVLCAIPPLQHQRDLTLKPEYMPGTGTALAASLVINQGSAISGFDPCNQPPAPAGDCPRYVTWSVTAATDTVTLRLSNLKSGPDITVRLVNNATVTVSNQPQSPPPLTHILHAQRMDTPDWCLYFGLFEGNPGCPGPPPIPLACPENCIPSAAAAHKTTSVKSKLKPKVPHFMMIGTIACSNSQFP